MADYNDVVGTFDDYVDETNREINSLKQQIAERDAKISEHHEKTSELQVGLGVASHQLTRLFQEMRVRDYHAALDWIRRHRAAEAAEQPDTPDTPDDGELVPWTAETRPRGVVMFRVKARIMDIEIAIDRWTPQGAAMHHGAFSWFDLWQDWEWSRDGQTWQPCGTRKAVAK